MFKKYLVTGATGFLGRAVINQLLENKAVVYALTLENDPLIKELPNEVNAVIGNVCDKSSLNCFFADADHQTCVIHCAGIVSVASRPGEKIYKVNVEGTKNIVELCEEYRVGKLVHVSSVHAIPEKPKGLEITEDAVFAPDLVKGDYAKSKAIATSLVFDATKRGLNASVVFPSGIIGPGDNGNGSVSNMLISFLSGKLPLAVKGGYDFVDVRDVALGIIATAEKGQPGQGYILSGHYTSVKDILQIAKEVATLKRNTVYLPIIFAKLVAPIYEKITLRKNKTLFFTPYAIAVLISNGNFSCSKAVNNLGYNPRPIESTIKDTVLWLKDKIQENK